MKYLVCFIIIFIFNLSVNGQNANGTDRLLNELEHYSIDRNEYSGDLIPLLMGNAEIGGLADPLGRGFYQMAATDAWRDSTSRSPVPGIMLKFIGLGNEKPSVYHQHLDLVHGLLTTRVSYSKGGYQTEIFFSKSGKHTLALKVTNTGKGKLDAFVQFDFSGYSAIMPDSGTIQAVSSLSDFTRSSWAISGNVPLQSNFSHLPSGQNQKERKNYSGCHGDYTISIAPGNSAELFYAYTTKWDGEDFVRSALDAVKQRNFRNEIHTNNLAWDGEWANTAAIILPKGKYAETFYRSMFWLYCVAGADHFLPGEVQFADLPLSMAAEYGYDVKYNVTDNWNQHPFTYGGPGWSAIAFTSLGNKERAGKILQWIYQPDVLRKNVTNMFPVGKKEINGWGNFYPDVEYLNRINPDAMCFGHELMLNGKNIPAFPWDWQVHINAFASGLFHNYARLFGEDDPVGRMAYPVLKGTAEFWSELLKFNKPSKSYSLPPLTSLTEDLFRPDIIDGLLTAKWNLEMASGYAKKLKLDQPLNLKWKEIAEKIVIPQNKTLYLEYTGDDGSRKGGGYQGIRGFAYLAYPTTELLPSLDIQKIRRTLDQTWERNHRGQGMITFVANWFALADAYTREGNKALEKSSYCLKSLDISGTAMMETPTQRPYYLDSYAAFVAVPISMLVQSTQTSIEVFPALPDSWKDVAFYDVPATAGIRVSGEMKDGVVKWVTFTKDGKELFRTKEKFKVKIIQNGARISIK